MSSRAAGSSDDGCLTPKGRIGVNCRPMRMRWPCRRLAQTPRWLFPPVRCRSAGSGWGLSAPTRAPAFQSEPHIPHIHIQRLALCAPFWFWPILCLLLQGIVQDGHQAIGVNVTGHCRLVVDQYQRKRPAIRLCLRQHAGKLRTDRRMGSVMIIYADLTVIGVL